MHPENTTHPSLSQEAGRQRPLLTTIAREFHAHGNLGFCTTVSGAQCSAAINFASAILQSASRVCGTLIDAEDSAGLYAVMILIDQAHALIDSAAPGIEQAEDLASQNRTSQVRGAEESA